MFGKETTYNATKEIQLGVLEPYLWRKDVWISKCERKSFVLHYDSLSCEHDEDVNRRCLQQHSEVTVLRKSLEGKGRWYIQ